MSEKEIVFKGRVAAVIKAAEAMERVAKVGKPTASDLANLHTTLITAGREQDPKPPTR